MQTKYLALALFAATGALAQEDPSAGDLIKSAIGIIGDQVTSAAGAAGAAITSAAQEAVDNFKDGYEAGKSAGSELKGDIKSAGEKAGDKIESAAGAAASKLSSVNDKYKTFDGWEEFKEKYSSKKAEGKSAWDEYLKTQQVIPSTAVSAAASDLAAAITAPFSPSQTAEADGDDDKSAASANLPTIALGSLIGVVGVIAGAVLL